MIDLKKVKDIVIFTLISSSLILGVFFRRFRKTPPGVLLLLPFYKKEQKNHPVYTLTMNGQSNFQRHSMKIYYATPVNCNVLLASPDFPFALFLFSQQVITF